MVSRYRNFELNIECNTHSTDFMFSPLDFNVESAIMRSPPQTPFLTIYNELYKEFHASGVSQLRQQLLKKLAMESNLCPL